MIKIAVFASFTVQNPDTNKSSENAMKFCLKLSLYNTCQKIHELNYNLLYYSLLNNSELQLTELEFKTAKLQKEKKLILFWFENETNIYSFTNLEISVV